MLDLGASFKVMSSWDYNWRNPRLDGRFGAHISKADGNAKKPYWIEVDFLQDATVYAVVLKRRGDGAVKERVNSQIKVQYLPVDSSDWVYYKDGEVLPTGETKDTETDAETQINLEPFRAKSVAVWIMSSQQWIGARADFIISPEKKEAAPEPPAETSRAMVDLGYKYVTSSQWNAAWSNPRLDSTTAAHVSKADGAASKDFWIETDFDKAHDVYQVILKRRADTMSSAVLKYRTNHHIKVQYKDPDTKKWVWYQGDANNLLPTGQTENTPAEEELKINLFPFKALGVAVWFPSVEDPWISARLDFVVTKQEPKPTCPYIVKRK